MRGGWHVERTAQRHCCRLKSKRLLKSELDVVKKARLTSVIGVEQC